MPDTVKYIKTLKHFKNITWFIYTHINTHLVQFTFNALTVDYVMF